MKQENFLDLTVDQARSIISLLVALKVGKADEVKSKFLKLAGEKHSLSDVKNWNNRPKMTGGRARAIGELVCNLENDGVRRTMFTFCKQVLELPGISVEDSLFEWISPKEAGCPDFIEKETRGGKSLRYLIFRAGGLVDPDKDPEDHRNISCRVSLLEITYDPIRDALPKFETKRKDGATWKHIKGQIFESRNYIYSIGKVVRNPGIRFAKLSEYGRQIGRNGQVEDRIDMIGVRVGQSDDRSTQFGHIIYAYQLKTTPSSEETKLLEITNFGDAGFTNSLTKECRDLITQTVIAKNLIEGGLQVEKMPGRG